MEKVDMKGNKKISVHKMRVNLNKFSKILNVSIAFKHSGYNVIIDLPFHNRFKERLKITVRLRDEEYHFKADLNTTLAVPEILKICERYGCILRGSVGQQSISISWGDANFQVGLWAISQALIILNNI